MVDKVLRRVNGRTQQYTPVQASAGAVDAGKIPALNSEGKIDPSMYDAGKPGGGSGVSYILDHEPVGAQESETWWNPLTLQLKVYHNNEFEPVSPDGGHF